ncbi:hypothetical protein [Saccharopolyspora shandongensis]|uniref:hypothetical protein n=1 Tax=Saccharopolyspora shandongensis TaxID=418495 RepID=UPI0033DD5F59
MGQINRPGSLLDQIIALRRELATVRRTSGTGGRAISDGSLTIQRGGSLRMLDPDGTELVYLGPGPDGRQVIRFRRQGGGYILATYTTDDGRPAWALSAADGEPVVADDTGGSGLARPWIPAPITRVRQQDLPMVTAAEFETVVEARLVKTHPYVELSTLDTAEAGTAGEGRIVITDPTGRAEVVDTWTVGTEFADRRRGPFPLPGTPYAGTVTVAIQWRRTTGRGQLRSTALGLVQRHTPDEQPEQKLSTPLSTAPGRS